MGLGIPPIKIKILLESNPLECPGPLLRGPARGRADRPCPARADPVMQ